MKTLITCILMLCSSIALAGYRSISRSSFSSSRSYSRPSSSFFSSRTTTRSVTTPTVFRPSTSGFTAAPRAYVAPRAIPLSTTRTTVTTTIAPSRTVFVHSAPRTVVVVRPRSHYYYNNHYYDYPSMSLSSMALSMAIMNAARQDWTYTAIHIANQTPSRVCRCDSLGRVYACGLFRDERDYVCKQFRILPDDQVEWR